MNAVLDRLVCDMHGEYERREFRPLPGLQPIVLRCPECTRIEREREQIQRREQQLQSRRQRSGIPREYVGLTLRGYPAVTGPQIAVIDLCNQWVARFDELAASADKGSWLVFIGPPGTGKTGMACAVADALMIAGKSVVYHTAASLKRWVWDARHRGSFEAEAVAQLVGCELLVIDELGAGRGGEPLLDLIADLLDQRYAAGRPVVLISNLDRREMHALLPDRLVDRIEQRATWVPCAWESLRR